MRPPKARARAGLVVQVGQTLLVLGVALLVVGLFLNGSASAVWVGSVLAVVGLVLFVVGLRSRARDARG